MVVFTLRDQISSFSIRMDVPDGETMDEVSRTAADMAGNGSFLLSSGYEILDPDSFVGRSIRDGDVIDIIPDTRVLRKV